MANRNARRGHRRRLNSGSGTLEGSTPSTAIELSLLQSSLSLVNQNKENETMAKKREKRTLPRDEDLDIESTICNRCGRVNFNGTKGACNERNINHLGNKCDGKFVKIGDPSWKKRTEKMLETIEKEKKENGTMAKKVNKGTEKKATTKKTASKKTDPAASATIRKTGNGDPVAMYLMEKDISADALRKLVSKANDATKDKHTEGKHKKAIESIKATKTRSNAGLVRMTLGLMLRRFFKESEAADFNTWIKKVAKRK